MPTLKILTYNIFIRPPAPSFTHNVENDYKDQRLDEFISTHLNRFDIVCLQEMFGAFSRRRRRLCSAAKALGFHYKVTSPQCRSKGFLVDGGCVILSKYPIVLSDHFLFPAGIHSDKFAAKGVLYAKVEVIKSSSYIHLFSTHLQACYEGLEKETSIIRLKQINMVKEFICKKVYSKVNKSMNLDEEEIEENHVTEVSDINILPHGISLYPVLLVGDFNIDSRNGQCICSDCVEISPKSKLYPNKSNVDHRLVDEYAHMMDELKMQGYTSCQDLLVKHYNTVPTDHIYSDSKLNLKDDEVTSFSNMSTVTSSTNLHSKMSKVKKSFVLEPLPVSPSKNAESLGRTTSDISKSMPTKSSDNQSIADIPEESLENATNNSTTIHRLNHPVTYAQTFSNKTRNIPIESRLTDPSEALNNCIDQRLDYVLLFSPEKSKSISVLDCSIDKFWLPLANDELMHRVRGSFLLENTLPSPDDTYALSHKSRIAKSMLPDKLLEPSQSSRSRIDSQTQIEYLRDSHPLAILSPPTVNSPSSPNLQESPNTPNLEEALNTPTVNTPNPQESLNTPNPQESINTPNLFHRTRDFARENLDRLFGRRGGSLENLEEVGLTQLSDHYGIVSTIKFC